MSRIDSQRSKFKEQDLDLSALDRSNSWVKHKWTKCKMTCQSIVKHNNFHTFIFSVVIANSIVRTPVWNGIETRAADSLCSVSTGMFAPLVMHERDCIQRAMFADVFFPFRCWT